jgi:hypothetical protein
VRMSQHDSTQKVVLILTRMAILLMKADSSAHVYAMRRQ